MVLVRKAQTSLPSRPFTGYLNFSPDIVSSDYAEPRAQSLGQQEASRIQRSKIGAQNTKILRSASRSAPNARRFAVAKTDKKRIEDTLAKEKKLREYRQKLERAQSKQKK